MAQIRETTIGTKQNLTPTPEASNDPYATGSPVYEPAPVSYVAPAPIVEASNDPYATGQPVYEAPAATITPPVAPAQVQPSGNAVIPKAQTPAENLAAYTAQQNAQQDAIRQATLQEQNAGRMEVDPRTGMPIYSSAATTTAVAEEAARFSQGTNPQADVDRALTYQTIMNGGGMAPGGLDYPDANNAPLDPYGVQADADRRDADALAKTQATAENATPDIPSGSGGAAGISGGISDIGVGGGGATGTGGGTTGGAGTGTSGTQLLNQAISMKFEWTPDTDPDYQIASKQAENQIANMMIGRGGLWSSVTQNALSTKLFELQAIYRNQAYDNFKDERGFLVDMAQINFNREDEAWNQAFKIAQFNADREDQAFSRSMRQQEFALSQQKAQWSMQMEQAQFSQGQKAQQLNMDTADYTMNNKSYEQMLAQWKSSGTASNEVADFFGVARGMNINSVYGANAVNKVRNALDSQFQSITNTAREYNLDKQYLNAVNAFMDSSSASGSTNPKWEAGYADALNLVYGERSGETGSDAEAIAAKWWTYMKQNPSKYISQMGETLYYKLLADVQKLM